MWSAENCFDLKVIDDRTRSDSERIYLNSYLNLFYFIEFRSDRIGSGDLKYFRGPFISDTFYLTDK